MSPSNRSVDKIQFRHRRIRKSQEIKKEIMKENERLSSRYASENQTLLIHNQLLIHNRLPKEKAKRKQKSTFPKDIHDKIDLFPLS